MTQHLMCSVVGCMHQPPCAAVLSDLVRRSNSCDSQFGMLLATTAYGPLGKSECMACTCLCLTAVKSRLAGIVRLGMRNIYAPYLAVPCSPAHCCLRNWIHNANKCGQQAWLSGKKPLPIQLKHPRLHGLTESQTQHRQAPRR